MKCMSSCSVADRTLDTTVVKVWNLNNFHVGVYLSHNKRQQDSSTAVQSVDQDGISLSWSGVHYSAPAIYTSLLRQFFKAPPLSASFRISAQNFSI